MITRMLQVDSARVSVGTDPTTITPLSFLPIGVRGGDFITFNGTTLPVSQLVSQLFNLTMQASDTIAIKIKVPVQSIKDMSGDSPIPIYQIPLKLKVGSAAGSINGVQPILTPEPSSMSLSTIAINKEVVLDGIPVILGKDIFVEVSDITIVASRMVNVPYINLNLDALIIPTWIKERSADEWLGKAPVTASNSTDILNTNRLNEFLRTPLGDINHLSVMPWDGGTTMFRLYAPDTQRVGEFIMNLPSNAIMIAFQRGRELANAEAIPNLVTSLGWNSDWRAVISPDILPGTQGRTPILVASNPVNNLSISYASWGRGEAASYGPVQFMIVHNQAWPPQGLPADDVRLGLRFIVTPRLSSQGAASITFNNSLDLTLDGRNFANDPSPFNSSVGLWTKEAYRAAVFSYLPRIYYPVSSTSGMRDATRIRLKSPGGATYTVDVPESDANPFWMANPSGDVLSVTSSGPIGATVVSTGLHRSLNAYVQLPILVSWSAQI